MTALAFLIFSHWSAPAREIAEVFAELAPAVVRVKIITEQPDENGKPAAVVHVSSGFFIDDSGRLLTAVGNRNALSQAVRKVIEWKGVAIAAELVGYDPRTGVALLQVLQLPSGFATIPVRVPDQPLRIGAPLLSIATPNAVTELSAIELPPTPVRGMITGYEGSIATFDFPFTYLRSDLLLHGGEAGAAVLDQEGQLAGIAVLWVSEVRSCYLVPSIALARKVEDLTNRGRVTYRDLPLKFAEQENADHTALQVVISEVAPGGPAARAGLRANDVVRRIGTTAIRRIRDVHDALFFARTGEYTPIEVERDGRREEWVLRVEEIPGPAAAPADSSAPRGSLRPSVVDALPDHVVPPPPPPRYLDALERALAPGSN